jgi:high-affinity nickel permease
MQRAGAWMRRNLRTRGYRLCDEDSRALAVGLRFSTGHCLTLVIIALASSAIIVALSAIGVVAGATPAGLVLGALLVAACAVVTATNLCLPSETFAWWAHRCARRQRAIT